MQLRAVLSSFHRISGHTEPCSGFRIAISLARVLRFGLGRSLRPKSAVFSKTTALCCASQSHLRKLMIALFCLTCVSLRSPKSSTPPFRTNLSSHGVKMGSPSSALCSFVRRVTDALASGVGTWFQRTITSALAPGRRSEFDCFKKVRDAEICCHFRSERGCVRCLRDDGPLTFAFGEGVLREQNDADSQEDGNLCSVVPRALPFTGSEDRRKPGSLTARGSEQRRATPPRLPRQSSPGSWFKLSSPLPPRVRSSSLLVIDDVDDLAPKWRGVGRLRS